MKLALLMMLGFASLSAANPACYSGSIPGPDGKSITKDQFTDLVLPMLGASLLDIINGVPKFKSWIETRGKCQGECYGQIMEITVPTLYGKLGKDIMKEDETVIEGFTGAFRACFPSPPREEIKKLSTAIVKGMGKSKGKGKIPELKPCKNQAAADDFPLDQVMQEFGSAFEKVISANPQAVEFFTKVAKDCQLKCVEKSVPLAIKTVFLTGADPDEVADEAITGALHACFPGIPSEEIKRVVDATISTAKAADADARLRLYTMKMAKPLVALGFFPLCGIVTAISLMLFSAGVAMGRRWNSKRPSIGRHPNFPRIGVSDNEQDLMLE